MLFSTHHPIITGLMMTHQNHHERVVYLFLTSYAGVNTMVRVSCFPFIRFQEIYGSWLYVQPSEYILYFSLSFRFHFEPWLSSWLMQNNGNRGYFCFSSEIWNVFIISVQSPIIIILGQVYLDVDFRRCPQIFLFPLALINCSNGGHVSSHSTKGITAGAGTHMEKETPSPSLDD